MARRRYSTLFSCAARPRNQGIRGLALAALLAAALHAFGAHAHGGQETLLEGVRHNASPERTRIILDLTGPARFEAHLLDGDTAKSLPPRVYIDLLRARLGTPQREVVMGSTLLRRVRLGQFKPDVVRVVLDMNGKWPYETLVLRNPDRLVVDVHGTKQSESVGKPPADKAAARAGPRVQRIRKIVLDPGHGGKDPGALGHNGVMEKDIVLRVAKKLARKLERGMGVDVVLTRSRDVFVPLEDRTAMANAEDADLFISLHVNASENRRAAGLETYYLDNTTDEAAIRLAARENSTSRRDITDLQFILSDLVQNSKLADSVSLAGHVQSALVGNARRRYRGARDLGVKKGLFYVLVGARMPAILAELFFVTNRTEERALTSDRLQDALVDGLYDGIQRYSRELLVAKNL